MEKSIFQALDIDIELVVSQTIATGVRTLSRI